jgi:uncharacterized membrane protein YphA (DoxX/SURF4 family)
VNDNKQVIKYLALIVGALIILKVWPPLGAMVAAILSLVVWAVVIDALFDIYYRGVKTAVWQQLILWGLLFCSPVTAGHFIWELSKLL